MIRAFNIITRYGLSGLLLSLLGVTAAHSAQLIQAKANTLITGQLGLELIFDAPVGEITDHLQYQPNQLVIDIPKADSALELNPLPLDMATVKELRSESDGGDLTLFLELKSLSPYTISRQGSRLFIQIGSLVTRPKSVPAMASEQPIVSALSSSPVPTGENYSAIETINRVNDIDFRRTKDGSGQLLIKLNGASVAADIIRRDQSISVEFLNTDIVEELISIMDVNDFSTPVNHIEVFEEEGKVRLDVAISGDFDYRYDQAENLFLIEVQPVENIYEDEEKRYQGKPISLNFQDIPIRTVLQLIADFNHLNLVTTDSITGNITLRLDDVPWEQALDIILKVKGLAKRLDNNVLLVAPASELAEQERQELESTLQVAELSALYGEYIQINYAKAEDISTLLKSQDTSMLSSRGTAAVDARTNTLLVRDTQESLENIKKMISVLDVPVQQVVIEARIVTVSEDVSDALGVSLGFTYGDNDSRLSTSGSSDGIDGWLNGDSDSNDRLNVNLPVTGSNGTIAFQLANIGDSGILDLELSALEEEEQGEVIASPRITTSNQHEAYIEQGIEIPYEESTSSGATSISFEKAVISLTVTPQITPDNKVILDLVVTQDSQGDTVDTGTGTAIAIDTQEISTQVLVNDGETIVLGGIYQQTITDSTSKVPFLGDLPLIGWMFKNSNSSNQKNELLIFVTPKIVIESL